MSLTLEVTHTLDPAGHEVVNVPLANAKKSVQLYAKDFDTLLSLGVPLPWRLRQGQIIVMQGQKPLGIARLLLDAGIGEQISCLNQDPCDLRMSNLIRVKGNGKSRARDLLEPSYKKKQVEVVHTKQINQNRSGLNYD
jgi:hypothetical protein